MSTLHNHNRRDGRCSGGYHILLQGMGMRIATVDLETFWSVGHSLSKMSPIAYCMHPDTEIISCAFKFDDGPTEVVFGEADVIAYASKIDWSEYWVIGHNLSGFDAMILSWRMNIKPMMWGCTLAMSRPIHAKNAGGSLARLVEHYNLGVKDQSALVATKGKHLCDFTEQEIADMKVYNAADVDQCYALFKKLVPQTRKGRGQTDRHDYPYVGRATVRC